MMNMRQEHFGAPRRVCQPGILILNDFLGLFVKVIRDDLMSVPEVRDSLSGSDVDISLTFLIPHTDPTALLN